MMIAKTNRQIKQTLAAASAQFSPIPPEIRNKSRYWVASIMNFYIPTHAVSTHWNPPEQPVLSQPTAENQNQNFVSATLHDNWKANQD